MYKKLTLLLVLSLTQLVNASEYFSQLSFDKALEQAKLHKKYLFVDFYATWCGPCKMLDKEVWPKKEVKDLLLKHTIPLKIDAEKELNLASKYNVNSYPTMLLLESDGRVKARFTGFRPAEAFIELFNNALEGITPLQQVQKAIEKGEDKDPGLHYKYADLLVEEGKYKEALKEYLWCYNTGFKQDPRYAGVRNSFLLNQIIQLAQIYPPAKDEILKLRKNLESQIHLETFERPDLFAILNINNELNQTEKNLSYIDQMPESSPNYSLLIQQLLPDLVKQKRYKTALKANDPIKIFTHAKTQMDQLKTQNSNNTSMKRYMDYLQSSIIKGGGLHVEALCGTDQTETAKKLSDLILNYTKTKETKKLLLTHAKRAGNPEVVEYITNKDI